MNRKLVDSKAVIKVSAMLKVYIFQGIHRIIGGLILVFACRFLNLSYLKVMTCELIFGLGKRALSLAMYLVMVLRQV